MDTNNGNKVPTGTINGKEFFKYYSLYTQKVETAARNKQNKSRQSTVVQGKRGSIVSLSGKKKLLKRSSLNTEDTEQAQAQRDFDVYCNNQSKKQFQTKIRIKYKHVTEAKASKLFDKIASGKKQITFKMFRANYSTFKEETSRPSKQLRDDVPRLQSRAVSMEVLGNDAPSTPKVPPLQPSLLTTAESSELPPDDSAETKQQDISEPRRSSDDMTFDLSDRRTTLADDESTAVDNLLDGPFVQLCPTCHQPLPAQSDEDVTEPPDQPSMPTGVSRIVIQQQTVTDVLAAFNKYDQENLEYIVISELPNLLGDIGMQSALRDAQEKFGKEGDKVNKFKFMEWWHEQQDTAAPGEGQQAQVPGPRFKHSMAIDMVATKEDADDDMGMEFDAADAPTTGRSDNLISEEKDPEEPDTQPTGEQLEQKIIPTPSVTKTLTDGKTEPETKEAEAT